MPRHRDKYGVVYNTRHCKLFSIEGEDRLEKSDAHNTVSKDCYQVKYNILFCDKLDGSSKTK